MAVLEEQAARGLRLALADLHDAVVEREGYARLARLPGAATMSSIER